MRQILDTKCALRLALKSFLHQRFKLNIWLPGAGTWLTCQGSAAHGIQSSLTPESHTILQDGFALPYSVWDNSTTQGMKLLADSHAQLMAYHQSKGINFPADVMDAIPTEAVVAFWDPSITWSGGAWHSNVSFPFLHKFWGQSLIYSAVSTTLEAPKFILPSANGSCLRSCALSLGNTLQMLFVMHFNAAWCLGRRFKDVFLLSMASRLPVQSLE